MTDAGAALKLGRDGKAMLGPNGKPMRSLRNPFTLRGKLWIWRYLIARRFVQCAVLLLFFATVNWGWAAAGRPVLTGNLSASELLGLLPMADPFAALQIMLTGHGLQPEVLIGAGVILALYGLVAGRAFCSWVCPINMATDLANWLRRKLPINDVFRLRRNTRYIVLVLALGLSALTGVAAFEWISPISMFHRELIYGVGLGWTAVLGVFLFDLFILKNGWCGHLCPLGAFYALLGSRTAQLRVRFDAETCTHCGECATICPEPQVLNLKQAAEAGWVTSGECTNCGRCTPVCAEDTLGFDLRFLAHKRGRTVAQPDKHDESNSNSYIGRVI